MAIPEQFIDELLARADIADVVGDYVHLTPKGGNLWGLCPFHTEKTPSFSVSRSKHIYYCFGCHKGGNAIHFIMEMEHLSYPDAIRHLAKREGMETPETGGSEESRRKYLRCVEANKAAARFYYQTLGSEEGACVREYIAKRRISPKFTVRFGLGAATGEWDALTHALTAQGFSKLELIDAGLAVAGKNGGVYDKFRSRLMLPVIDVRGDVVGFTSRLLPGLEGAKYLNSPDTVCFKKSRLVYGLNLAKATKRPNLILVEGNIDVITLHQAGFDNVVATMGTALTSDHARVLSRYTKELVICYDNDDAGKKSTDRVLGILRNADLSVRVLQLPNATDSQGRPVKQDPDDFVKRFGPAAFEKCLNGSAGKNDYQLDTLTEKADLSTDEGRMDFLRSAVETVGRMESPIEREIYGGKAAAAGGISERAFAQEVERWRKDRSRQERKKEERREMTPAVARQPSASGLRYDDLRSAMAEEGLVRLVLLDPALLGQADIAPEEFSAPVLGKAYGLLRERRQKGLSVQLSALGSELTAEEMGHLIALTAKPESLAHAQETMGDYIDIIRSQRRGTPQAGERELLELRDKQRKKKMEDGI